jgi:AraC family transcriptional regulator of adaptative response/methylated-DNA-[protein]-cysteine methyltransferase
LRYTIAPSKFGQILIAATEHGICWIGVHGSAEHLESELLRDCSKAQIIRDDVSMAQHSSLVFGWVSDSNAMLDLPLDVRATRFQLTVWRELCKIPRGMTSTYGEIARRIGQPEAPRAVGHANGSNPTAIIIPCHRAIGANGALTGYRWGVALKRRLLEAEGALPERTVAAVG